MKKLIVGLLIVFGTMSCKNHDSEIKIHKETEENFDWLLGNWIRINEKEGKQTYESWTKNSNSEYRGHGFTLQEKDTVWQEKVRLIKSGKDWNFSAIAPGEQKATVFKLTTIQQDVFTCENQQNEFPKIIRYFKKGALLHATISGGEMEISFDFKSIRK